MDESFLKRLDISSLKNIKKDEIELEVKNNEYGVAGRIIQNGYVKVTHKPTSLTIKNNQYRSQLVCRNAVLVELDKLLEERNKA
ncbi:hypothetical protein KCM76_23775 [Zooshikella marina]|uniref:hypothetical protein n=1 Tax=Zooshikella ganghwensis TaxID=202772 RepID=UPI001BB0B2A1|nr:hypothetical protein [Zooshikella ganghwensis]MBU2709036.1 hypothetical protein [Zooshikella ganghwensis]